MGRLLKLLRWNDQCNERKSAAKICHQVAAWVPDMFCNICAVKSHKIANNLATTENRAKISTYLEFVEFYRNVLINVWLDLKTIKFYLIELATDF